MSIRKCTASDLPLLVDIINSSYLIDESHLFDGTRTNLSDLSKLTSQENNQILVLEIDGKPSGSILLSIDHTSKVAHFGMLSVALSQQKKGYSRLLVTAAEDTARAAGMNKMEIDIIECRTSLQSFYGKLGYHQTGVGSFPDEPIGGYSLPKVKFNMLLLEKDL
ncbi:N-acetyltransferase [Planoprotostelium fungivorum]|uniref:N-acetyltransferase n=1 Tax=Planoprotostelium fungivorum TaxID=1890364 RepID=A0A2P6N0D9_9EUKA|nr:N-acetyltransferase [Planoprotostelium fungivorum]